MGLHTEKNRVIIIISLILVLLQALLSCQRARDSREVRELLLPRQAAAITRWEKSSNEDSTSRSVKTLTSLSSPNKRVTFASDDVESSMAAEIASHRRTMETPGYHGNVDTVFSNPLGAESITPDSSPTSVDRSLAATASLSSGNSKSGGTGARRRRHNSGTAGSPRKASGSGDEILSAAELKVGWGERHQVFCLIDYYQPALTTHSLHVPAR